MSVGQTEPSDHIEGLINDNIIPDYRDEKNPVSGLRLKLSVGQTEQSDHVEGLISDNIIPDCRDEKNQVQRPPSDRMSSKTGYQLQLCRLIGQNIFIRFIGIVGLTGTVRPTIPFLKLIHYLCRENLVCPASIQSQSRSDGNRQTALKDFPLHTSGSN